MTVPKYVGVYFTAGVRTSKTKVLKRLKTLEDSEWGMYTSEYKDLKRYAKVLREQSFSKIKYYNRNKKKDVKKKFKRGMVRKTKYGYQVYAPSPLGGYILQGQPHKTEKSAFKDARNFDI